MKKSKKALLWTIVPVLGVSSGVAGAVAGVTNQKTSVDTNNVATPGSATTMATKSSKSTSSIKIAVQPRDVLTFSEDPTQVSMNVYVDGSGEFSRLKYEWKVNKGDGNWTLCLSSREKGGEFLFMFLASNSRFAFTIKNIASWLLNSEAQ